MQALILAAGEGRRLRPHTELVPKPMLSIAGRPILEHNVRLLGRYGIRDLIINLHDRPEVIEGYFGDGSAFGANISYSREFTLRGTGGAVDAIRNRLSGDFVVLYGDNLSTCRIDRLLSLHQKRKAALTMAVFHRDDVAASGIVAIDGDGRITRFLEKPRTDQVFSHWVNAGIFICSQRLLDYIPSGKYSDLSYDILPDMLKNDELLYTYEMQEHLWWVDLPEEYERALGDPEIRAALGDEPGSE